MLSVLRNLWPVFLQLLHCFLSFTDQNKNLLTSLKICLADTIILLGAFNCDLFGLENKVGNAIQPKTRRLLNLFHSFDMQNIINTPTRMTLESRTLIDLIVTTKPRLIKRKGVLPLGISDHCLIYATLSLSQKCPPPKVINIRSFKKFQVDQSQADISAAPFHVAHIFDHRDDVLRAWNSLFKEICDFHAPVSVLVFGVNPYPGWITALDGR